MPAAPATIEQLAADTVMTDDPESALRALSALRHELAALEPELVSRALEAGASWSHIARALGVSKQAAHRKHRHLTEQAFRAVGAEPKILVTSEARRSVQFAREEAKSSGQPMVGTEHLLLGILRCERSHASKALLSLGISLERAKACLRPTLTGNGQAPPAAEEGRGTITAHARRILEGSLREALKRGDGYIGVEHLLLALLADSRNGAVQTLEALHTTPKQIRRRLEHEWLAVGAVNRSHATDTTPSRQLASSH